MALYLWTGKIGSSLHTLQQYLHHGALWAAHALASVFKDVDAWKELRTSSDLE
jgi:hypothetical protein